VFAISWGGLLIVVGGPSGIPGTAEQVEALFPFALLAMFAGPLIGGIVLTGLLYGRAGLHEFGSRLLKWRVGARWYAVALLTAGHLGLESFTRLRRRHVGEIGMAVRNDWQGRGVGTALMEAVLDLADNWLDLTRVELSVYTDNGAAVALYEKFSFEFEGTHRRYALRNDEYVDAYSMARIE